MTTTRLNLLKILSLFLIVKLASCSNGDNQPIAFLHPSNNIIRFTVEANAFKDYCSPKGYEVIIESADDDESLQIEQARKMIDQDVSMIVLIAVNINTAAVIVREAHESGIPVMAYNRMIKNCEVDFFMGSNGDLIGKTMVDALLDESGGGNFVILGGDKFDKNGLDLQNAAKKYLKPYVKDGKINIVYETFIEQWRPSIAAFEMEKIISLYGTDIDAVLAGSDGMANAVIEVLKKYNLEGKVAISGQDAELIACKNIINGYQTVTVYHPLKKIAKKAGEIAIEMIQNKKIDNYINSTEYNGMIDVPTHRVNSIGVNNNNLNEVLINSGFYTKQQVYN